MQSNYNLFLGFPYDSWSIRVGDNGQEEKGTKISPVCYSSSEGRIQTCSHFFFLDFHPMLHLSPNKIGAQVPSQLCQKAFLYLLVSATSSALYSNASYSPVSGHCFPCWCPLLMLAASEACWKLGEGSGTPWLTQPHVSWSCALRVLPYSPPSSWPKDPSWPWGCLSALNPALVHGHCRKM